MKKYVLLTAVALILAAPGIALSQNAPSGNGGGFRGGPGGPDGPGAQGMQEENGHQGNGERFQEHKAEMLKRLNEHLAEVQKRISCVQAAANHEALRACMPERGEGPQGGRGMQGGERPQ